jgi:hypothetical protein
MYFHYGCYSHWVSLNSGVSTKICKCLLVSNLGSPKSAKYKVLRTRTLSFYCKALVYPHRSKRYECIGMLSLFNYSMARTGTAVIVDYQSEIL